MLRTCTFGGHAPLHKGPLQLQPEKRPKPQQCIVDIVQQSETTPGVTTFLYDIRRRADSRSNVGTFFVSKAINKERKQHIELKTIDNDRLWNPRSLPVVGSNRAEEKVGKTEEQTINPHQQIHVPVKRILSKPININGSKPKSVRFRDEQTKSQQVSDLSSPHDSKSSSKKTELDCEVRGNAIGPDITKPRVPSPSRVRVAEVQRRQNSFQSSLQLFRRRLRLNQEKILHSATTRDDGVRILNDTNTGQQQTIIYPSPPQEQRRSNLQSSHRRLRVKYPQLSGRNNGNETETHKVSKTEHSLNFQKQENGRIQTPISKVKTYVLEDKGELLESNTEQRLTLTTHNLNVHNTLIAKPGTVIKVGNDEICCEPRLVKWLQGSNNRVQREHIKSTAFEVFGKKVGSGGTNSVNMLSARSHASSDHFVQ